MIPLRPTSHEAFCHGFHRYIADQFPHFVPGAAHLSPLLISPEVVTLPQGLEREMKSAVASLLATNPSLATPPNRDAGEKTFVASFDFYWTPEGLRLIEVNTNAAAWVLVSLLHGYHGFSNPRETLESLRRALHAIHPSIQGIAIVDETPTQQRTYFEFLWMQALFLQWGIEAQIFDPKDLRMQNGALMDPSEKAWAFVYNRFCDFELKTSEAQTLREAYETGAIWLRPSVDVYLRLSDKSRLLQWSSSEWKRSTNLSPETQEGLARLIPTVRRLSPETAAEFWNTRKQWFFKPQDAYGGKSAYSGTRISRSVFARLVELRVLAQPLFQAPLWTGVDGMSWKYDIRAYVVGDEVISFAARLFQGQVSNFQTPGGGFAPVVFSSCQEGVPPS